VRSTGDIVLLSTYELGHQPLGLAAPLAFLERAGFHPRAFDLSVESFDEAAVRAARLLAISVPMHTALRLGVRAATRARAINPSLHICFHGLYAPLNRAYLIERGLCDSVLGGEAEAELVALAEGLERGERAPAHREIVLDRLSFPEPVRDRLPVLSRYARLLDDGGERIAGYTEASRGCLHHCRHCPIPAVYGGRFFVVPTDVVLADIDKQVAAGARHVTLGDPDFFNGPRHAIEVARALHAAHPALTFDVTIKIEHILKHADLFPELAQLGCAFVVSAVESLAPRVLEILDKGHTAADVDRALDVLDAAGLPMRPTFVPFTPWSTLEDFIELIDWIERRDLAEHVDPIQLAIRLLIPPGSKLLELDETKRVIGALDEERLTYRWTHPDARMDRLQVELAACVERAAKGGLPAREVHAEIARRARALAPTKSRDRAATHPPPPRRRPARLTEAWFC
jgi:radical SAM superfamily enzyme YgiQ (UPF0313 family)